MADAERQMPQHVGAAYKHAAENIIFLKRQQWFATNYALLLYAAIFVISAHYFSRTDVARNRFGVLTIGAFVIHWWVLHLLQNAIASLETAWTGFTAPISPERSVRDWVCGRSQKHMGIIRRFTLASWPSH